MQICSSSRLLAHIHSSSHPLACRCTRARSSSCTRQASSRGSHWTRRHSVRARATRQAWQAERQSLPFRRRCREHARASQASTSASRRRRRNDVERTSGKGKEGKGRGRSSYCCNGWLSRWSCTRAARYACCCTCRSCCSSSATCTARRRSRRGGSFRVGDYHA